MDHLQGILLIISGMIFGGVLVSLYFGDECLECSKRNKAEMREMTAKSSALILKAIKKGEKYQWE